MKEQHIRKLLQDNIEVVFSEVSNELLPVLAAHEQMFDDLVVRKFAEREFGDEPKNLEFKYDDKSGRHGSAV